MKYEKIRNRDNKIISLNSKDFNISKEAAIEKYGEIYCSECKVPLNIVHAKGSKNSNDTSKQKFQIRVNPSAQHKEECFYNHYHNFLMDLDKRVRKISTYADSKIKDIIIEERSSTQTTNNSTNKLTRPSDAYFLRKMISDDDVDFAKLKERGNIISIENPLVLNWNNDREKLKNFYILEINPDLKYSLLNNFSKMNINLDGLSKLINNENGKNFHDYFRNRNSIAYNKKAPIQIEITKNDLILGKVFLLIVNMKLIKKIKIKFVTFDSILIINTLQRKKLEQVRLENLEEEKF